MKLTWTELGNWCGRITRIEIPGIDLVAIRADCQGSGDILDLGTYPGDVKGYDTFGTIVLDIKLGDLDGGVIQAACETRRFQDICTKNSDRQSPNREQ